MSDLPAPHRVEMDRGEAWSPNEDLRGVKQFEMLEMFLIKIRRASYQVSNGWEYSLSISSLCK